MLQTHQTEVLLDGGEICQVTLYEAGQTIEARARWPRTPGHYLVIVAITPVAVSLSACAEHPKTERVAAGHLAICDMEHPWALRASGEEGLVLSLCFSQAAYAALCAPSCTTAKLTAAPADPHYFDPVVLQLALGLAVMRPWRTDPRGLCPGARIVIAMLLHLGRNYGYADNTRRTCRVGLSQWQMQRVTAYIAAHLGMRIGVSDVASTCGLSPNYFNRLFKQTTGVTLHQWLMERRVTKAKQLLASTSMPIVDVAAVTGFADQTHFTRVFSQRTQFSPMSWRRITSCGGDPDTSLPPAMPRTSRNPSIRSSAKSDATFYDREEQEC